MDQLLSFGLYLTTITCIFLLLAMSLELQVGQCGLVNFGQVVFLAVGGYVVAILVNRGIGPLLATFAAVLAGAVLGALMSLTVRNLSGTYWGILSLSTAEIVRLVALNERWLTNGANGLSVIVTVPHLPWLVIG